MTALAAGAFTDCAALETVVLPGAMQIDPEAFAGCAPALEAAEAAALPFADVPAAEWYYRYVCLTYESGKLGVLSALSEMLL